ncbi:MAG: hypothetical protein ACREOD_01020 [Candidatus Dormibacteria bacterium]
MWQRRFRSPGVNVERDIIKRPVHGSGGKIPIRLEIEAVLDATAA